MNSRKYSDKPAKFLEICKFKTQMQKQHTGPLLVLRQQICHWYWSESWSFVTIFCKCLYWYFWWCFAGTLKEKFIIQNEANYH